MKHIIIKKIALLSFLFLISSVISANIVKIEMKSVIEGKSIIYKISKNSIKLYKKGATFKILIGYERMTKNEYNNFTEIRDEVSKALLLDPPDENYNPIDGFSWTIEFGKNKEYTIHSSYNQYFDKLIAFVNNLLKTKNRKIALTKHFK